MLLIRGGKTIDVLGGMAKQCDWVIDDSGRLVACDGVDILALPDHCVRLQADGLYLVPGLIDAHVHLGRPRVRAVEESPEATRAHVSTVAERTMRGGVTLVRDLGDRWPHGVAVAGLAGALDAPRVVSALSGITVPRGYGRFLGEPVGDTDELLSAVRRRYEAGARVIKMFLTGGVDFATGAIGPPQFDHEAIALVATVAHDLGLTLSVHANGPEAVMMAASAGADTIEHGILVDDDGVRAMADRGVFWVPTLTPLSRALRSDGDASEEGAVMRASLRRLFEQHKEATSRGFELGIKVVAGTDAGSRGVPHGCLVEELELLVSAGLQPAEVLKAATVWSAEALGHGHETGLLAPGRLGDLLVLRSDPLKDIVALRDISQIISGGTSPRSNAGPKSKVQS